MAAGRELEAVNFDLLIGEIESGSSGSVAKVIRKLREHEEKALVAGVGGPIGDFVASFITALDSRVEHRNHEIEQTCSHHYQGFMDSTRELVGIQDDSVQTKEILSSLNDKLQEAVSSVRDFSGALSFGRLKK